MLQRTAVSDGGGDSKTMSREGVSRYEIPGELQQLLLDFTVCCLVERPANLIEFAAYYFIELRQRQEASADGVKNSNGPAPESDDSMLTDDSDEPLPGTFPIPLI